MKMRGLLAVGVAGLCWASSLASAQVTLVAKNEQRAVGEVREGWTPPRVPRSDSPICKGQETFCDYVRKICDPKKTPGLGKPGTATSSLGQCLARASCDHGMCLIYANTMEQIKACNEANSAAQKECVRQFPPNQPNNPAVAVAAMDVAGDAMMITLLGVSTATVADVAIAREDENGLHWTIHRMDVATQDGKTYLISSVGDKVEGMDGELYVHVILSDREGDRLIAAGSTVANEATK